MGQFSTEIYAPPGSTLSGNQHLTQLKIAQRSGDRAQLPALRAAVIEARQVAVDGANAQLASSANFVLDQFDQ
jgi:hypothetical protein